ncbi:MAG: molybdate ABC transporter substrate-binding protein [Burkholderiales bacterium]
MSNLLRPFSKTRVLLGFTATLLFIAGAMVPTRQVQAEDVLVAVAANFLEPMQALQEPFNKQTGHTIKISAGSTGAFYTQIRNGAPFDVLLAADQERPQLLEKAGLTVPKSRFTYAIGKLVLWSADPTLIGADGKDVLQSDKFKYLAIANPATAPYGAAAQKTLENLGLWEQLTPKMVRGNDLAQTFQFVATRNAQLGFVAMSQAIGPHGAAGSRWDVPSNLHKPILQDAVLLKRAANNPAATALMDYLRSPATQNLIKSYGYDLAN